MAALKIRGKQQAEPSIIETVQDARKVFTAEYNRDSDLDDESIQALLDGEPDPIDAVKFVKIMKTAEDEARAEEEEEPEGEDKTKSVAVRDADATAIGTRLNDNEGFTASIHDVIETDQKRRRLPAHVAFYMQQTLGVDELLRLPVPSSTREDMEGTNTPNLFDTRAMKDGGGSFWGDAFDATVEGVDIAGRLAGVQAAIDKTVDAPKEYQGWDADRLNKEKAAIKAERTSGLRAMKGGVNLLRRFAELSDRTHLTAKFITSNINGKAEIVRSDMTIEVSYIDNENARVRSWWSVGQFMTVNIDDVVKAGATAEDQYKAFKPQRAAKTPDGDNDVSIKTLGQFESCMPEVYYLLDDTGQRTDLVNRLYKDEGKDLLLTLGKVSRQLGQILGNPRMAARLRELEAEEIKARAAA